MRIDEKVFFGGCVSGFGIAGETWRGWIVPVGGSTPDRLRSDQLGPVQDGGEEMRIDEKVCFGGCVSGFGIAGEIWRGWIVPVGGSTPDRLRADRLGPVRDGGEEMRIDEKVFFGGCVSGFGIAGETWRGWIVPVGGSTPDRLKVWGSTPDRLKVWGATPDRHRSDRNRTGSDRLKGGGVD